MSGYENLIVRAEFRSSVALETTFTLDGLLGSLIIRSPDHRRFMRYRRNYKRMCERYGQRRTQEIFAEKGWEIPDDTHMLPLDVWGHGVKHGLWVFMASYAFPDEPWEYDTVYWTRRVNSEQVLRWVDGDALPRRVQTGKGRYRSYRMPLPVLVAPALTWYVRGKRKEIEMLLRDAPFVGKKRAQGRGRVRRWSVEPDNCERSVWDGNKLMRQVPAELLNLLGIDGEFQFGYYSYKPPYHESRNFTRCAIDGMRQ